MDAYHAEEKLVRAGRGWLIECRCGWRHYGAKTKRDARAKHTKHREEMAERLGWPPPGSR
jgi:hypothetical protein